jgi:hypothetical protein
LKILFVGEGPHELGSAEPGYGPHPATGPVPILTRRICPSLGAEHLGIKWNEIQRYPVNQKQWDRDLAKSGYRSKAKSAVILSVVKFKCDGTVCVADGDTAPPDCLEQIRQGQREGLEKLEKLGRRHAAACGVACQSVDAWTLGARKALADELGTTEEVLRRYYPPKHVEELFNQSGKEEHRPKAILDKIATAHGRSADTAFRTAVAERTEIEDLEKECPKGFKPFAEDVRRAFAAPA